MRTHIAKALQQRCKAIRNAVKAYNAAAQALDPPRPTLDWSRVSHYSFLEEFELLRGSRQDIQDKRWAELAVRETMKQNLRIKRAKEEVERCNIEIRRVSTAIVDEHHMFDIHLARLQDKANPIYGAVLEHVELRRKVNFQILAHFEMTYALKGFTGNQIPGVCKGSFQPPQSSVLVNAAMTELDKDDEDDGDFEISNEGSGDIGGLVDYISQLPLQN